MSIRILIGDCTVRLKELPDNSVDSVVCDPPYHLTSMVRRLSKTSGAEVEKNFTKTIAGQTTNPFKTIAKGFMGQEWDGGDVAFRPETWAEVLRVLKPGGHLVAFSGTRTYHRMAVAIEDAGFEVRDMLSWLYGSGFPKSLDVSKAIDKAAGAEREVVGERKGGAALKIGGDNPRPWHERQAERGGTYDVTAPATEAAREWQGWGTALKPACEPICLARKPLSEKSVAANVLRWGTGAINVDACRIGMSDEDAEFIKKTARPNSAGLSHEGAVMNRPPSPTVNVHPQGRWPANVCHDGSDEVVAGFPETTSGALKPYTERHTNATSYQFQRDKTYESEADSGSAARFFYCAKATTEERGEGNNHPTVKPVALMEWLVKLVTPKGGTVLDPFMGSGSTALACDRLQFDFIGCELSPEYAAIAESRVKAQAGMFADVRIAA